MRTRRKLFEIVLPAVMTIVLQGCSGDNGSPGAAGQNCWDLNGNGAWDVSTEDRNGDGVVDVLDCNFPILLAPGPATPGSTIPSITVAYGDAGSLTLPAREASTTAATGQVLRSPVAAPVASTPLPITGQPTLILQSEFGGASMLGERYQLDVRTGTATVLKTFTGRPFADADETEAMRSSLVYNRAQDHFYGVLPKLASTGAGLLFRFDPNTDAFEVLKVLSTAGGGSTDGVGGLVMIDNARGGYSGAPLVSADGKGLILLASRGGRLGRGLLVHVNIDAQSADYLKETVVYEFFERDLVGTPYCQSLVGGFTQPLWSADRSKVFLGTQGSQYQARDAFNPSTCEEGPLISGSPTYLRRGRMFALVPPDPTRLAVGPWSYQEVSNFSPYASRLGRYAFVDRLGNLRWGREDFGAGEILPHTNGSVTAGVILPRSSIGCAKFDGILALDLDTQGLMACNGLDKESTPGFPIQEYFPTLFTHQGNGNVSVATTFFDWGIDFVPGRPPYKWGFEFEGVTTSTRSRQVFTTSRGNAYQVCSFDTGNLFPCDPSVLEVLNPGQSFFRTTLTSGSADIGFHFVGDPTVGSSDTSGLTDRYIVWLATQAADVSHVLNKYDRATGRTTTVRLDPDRGSQPLGPLVDIGNGQALGVVRNIPAPNSLPGYPSTSNPLRIGGYWGSSKANNRGARPGMAIVDVRTGQDRALADTGGNSPALPQGFVDSLEPARLDDGSVWLSGTAREDRAGQYVSFNFLKQVDPATGRVSDKKVTVDVRDDPVRARVPAGRGGAIYLPFDGNLDSDGTTRIACFRTSDPTIKQQSVAFGQGQSMAERDPVIGLTATDDAVYMLTATAADGTPGGSIFSIDEGVAPANLCTGPVSLQRVVTGLTEVPTTRLLRTRSGGLFFGTASGKLMRFDPVTSSVSIVANLVAGVDYSSRITGFLSEIDTDVIGAIVYDYDASGANVGRRLAGVRTTDAVVGNMDLTHLLDSRDSYPGVSRF